MIVMIGVFMLNGCYCCCPYPNDNENFTPEILGEMAYCELLVDMRTIAPLAGYRWPAKEVYQLTNLTETQRVINEIGSLVNLTETFLAQPGCLGLPFGYVKYSNNEEDYVTAVIGEKGIEFYKVNPSGQLTKMDPDNSITEIVLY
jgi:hypothetical protein